MSKKVKKGRLAKLNKKVVLAGIALLALPFIVLAAQHSQDNRQHAAAAGPAVSPLLFGTNLTLTDARDQFINSQATRNALASIHVQLIRMPIRNVGGPAPWEVQAMQDIKTMGLTPIIILKYSQPDPLTAAKLVLQQATGIFGTQQIYIEFGNERDLAGVNQTQYTTAWNQVISQLKPAFPTAMFGGPVNFQANPPYIAYFVHNATPKPDFISWHEYTCGNSSPASYCLAHIANWSTHISNTKAAIQANGDTVPPIFITEWNYDPNNPSPDSRATPQFQQQFTQAALQELANDGVTGATQYVSTGHTEYNFVDPSGNLTAEGQMFGQMYTQLSSGFGVNQASPFPTQAQPTAAPTAISLPTDTPQAPIATTFPTVSFTATPTLSAQNPGNAGVLCSTPQTKACAYTSTCSGVKEGTLCEYHVNTCGTASSGSNIYTCKNGTWVYSKWVKQGTCNFCGATKGQ